jgi:putative SOS response-associated peptidase YedK
LYGRYSIANFTTLKNYLTLAARHPVDLKSRYNIAPTQDVPAIIGRGTNRLAMFKWGLIPSWAKDPSIGNKMINARAETLTEKPSFKFALQGRRCLTVADGFYEWKKVGLIKKPYRITLKNNELFAFAGLWDTWRSPSGEVINSCSIITTSPNELMEPLHSRMPVILPREAEEVWLDGAIRDSEFLKSLLQPYPSGLMVAYELAVLVNSSRNDVPECLTPVLA